MVYLYCQNLGKKFHIFYSLFYSKITKSESFQGSKLLYSFRLLDYIIFNVL